MLVSLSFITYQNARRVGLVYVLIANILYLQKKFYEYIYIIKDMRMKQQLTTSFI